MAKQLWFKHGQSASYDPKLIMLRTKHGFRAMGIYWFTVELLYSESEHRILFDDNLIMLICSQDDPKLMSDFDNNKQQIKNILDEMIAIDLFQIRDDYLICESVINRVKEMAETSRKKATRGATKKGIVPEWMNE